MLVGRNRTTCSSVFLEHGPSKVSLQTIAKSSLLSLLSTCSELFYLSILCTKQHPTAFSFFKLGFVLLFKEVLGTSDGPKVLSRVTGLEVKEDKARSLHGILLAPWKRRLEKNNTYVSTGSSFSFSLS